jgi:hypothetical protein
VQLLWITCSVGLIGLLGLCLLVISLRRLRRTTKAELLERSNRLTGDYGWRAAFLEMLKELLFGW